ncbi:methyltransferase [Sphingorhabdus sp.]|uniref:methyltransferase n=1 Tax=Sphingorhabdus sp. TaxID=1902408 RepID=UPI00391A9511
MALVNIPIPSTQQELFPVEAEGQRADALLELLHHLDEVGYDFIAPTPASQARVVARADRQVGHGLMDLLGWSLPCRTESIPPDILACLGKANVLARLVDGMVSADIRVSRVFGRLFVHSAFPTTQQDAVFLGPDSHRFADFILRNLNDMPDGARVLDYGAGAGVGGITAASQFARAKLTLADINPKALFLAGINARYAALDYNTVAASLPSEVESEYDLIVMHPPFMIDEGQRAYRDGGDLYGGRLSVDWALHGMKQLLPGGRLVMHTGVSIVAGRDVVLDAFHQVMPQGDFTLSYSLLDPDIFGDELDTDAYVEVDRIAAVGIRIDRAR